MPFVIGQSDNFGFGFNQSHLKTALQSNPNFSSLQLREMKIRDKIEVLDCRKLFNGVCQEDREIKDLRIRIFHGSNT